MRIERRELVGIGRAYQYRPNRPGVVPTASEPIVIDKGYYRSHNPDPTVHLRSPIATGEPFKKPPMETLAHTVIARPSPLNGV